MALFRTIMNTITGRSSEPQSSRGMDADKIPEDLQKLELVEPGLARKVWDYISGAGDATVLSTLSQKGGALNGGGYVAQNQPSPYIARRLAFADPAMPTDALVRYVQVLTAARQGNLSSLREVPATDATRPELRVFLAELKSAHDIARAKCKDTPLPERTNDQLMEIVTGLGGTAEDLFDIVFYKDTHYGSGKGLELRNRMDLPALVRAEPEAFLAQNGRLPIPGRVRLFEFVTSDDLFDTPPFDKMVIDGLGDGAKAIREAALKAFARVDVRKREAIATKWLAEGNVDMRAAMVEALYAIGGETVTATLSTHLQQEKTARIRTSIEGWLQATDSANNTGDELETGYRALDGSTVEIPPLREPEDGPWPEITTEQRAQLLAFGEKLEEDYQSGLKTKRPQYYLKYAAPLEPETFQRLAEKVVNGQPIEHSEAHKDIHRRLRKQEVAAYIAAIRSTYPLRSVITQDIANFPRAVSVGEWAGLQRLSQIVTAFLDRSDSADLRFLDQLAAKAQLLRMRSPSDRESRVTMQAGELLLPLFSPRGGATLPSWRFHAVGNRADAIWPLVAENFWILDSLLGIVPNAAIPENKATALYMLASLPKVPAKYGTILMELVMTGTKDLRKAARNLLNHNDGYEAQLVDLCQDSRQQVRADAAKWLGDIGYVPAVKPLRAQLSKEKSVVAKAAILSALQALGQDISAHIGADALLKEASAGLKKANFKDVDWLSLTNIPQVHYRNGAPVPAEVLQWWIALAVKLKAPGDIAIFSLYLDQLAPEDASRLSTWVFDAWLGYDTAPLPEAEIDRLAQYRLGSMGKYWSSYFPESTATTEAEKLEVLRRQFRNNTPNSGAASKGILALAAKVPPFHAVAKVRSYLRKHGGRTSQALSLLELMAAKGDAMSLQVVIAAATRLRQKGVQAKANDLVQAVADSNDWTMDQLADRTVPTGGLDDDGQLELVCSGGEKLYVARLDEKLNLALFNPDGKPVKSLPSGTDDETKASKSALSAAKKEIKQAIQFQSARLFEAMCCGRRWAIEDWTRDFHEHPLMRKLVERLIWQGLNAEGEAIAAFRPTAEGEFIDASDCDVDLSGFTSLQLAHASSLTENAATAWRQHMKDYKVSQLFDQVRNNLPRLTSDMADETDISDRKGWVYDTFTLRGEATRAGWERGDALDGGGFDCYTRQFGSVGLVAVLEFSGNHVQQENIPAAIKTLYFEKCPAGQSRGYGSGQKLRLAKVPAVLLAECWADLHRITAKASYDPNWEKVCPW